jgi:hypothetical protein
MWFYCSRASTCLREREREYVLEERNERKGKLCILKRKATQFF